MAFLCEIFGHLNRDYALGVIPAIRSPIPVTLPGDVQAFEIEYELEQPVNADLYNYITEG